MKQKIFHVSVCVIVFLMMAPFAGAQDGANLYKLLCATCHDGGNERAPTRDVLKQMTPERILSVLETGAMLPMASNRTTGERRALAEFVSGKRFSRPLNEVPVRQAMCRQSTSQIADPTG